MSRSLHFMTPGFRPQIVDIAPDAEDPQSKRYEIFENEDKNLTNNLGELEEGTRARNRENERRLNEVWSMTSGWEAKLLTEKKEAEESITLLRNEYQRHINTFKSDILRDIHEIFDNIDNNLLPPQNDRVTAQQQDVDHFIYSTVPETVEKQSGEVSRQLKKQYETFDIEKQKAHKRERKFLQKANHHVQVTAQRFHDESALLEANFYNVEEDIMYDERHASRMHLRRYDLAVAQILELRQLIAAESEERTAEDVDLLDTVIDTQKLLQQTILEHFGSDEQAKDFGKSTNFKKLEKRLTRAASRDASRSREGNKDGSVSSKMSQSKISTKASSKRK